MSWRCTNPTCHVHDGEACAMGHKSELECPSWEKSPAESTNTPRPAEVSSRIPWSGSTLGLADLSLLAPRGRTILVGVMGAHDSGKTTLLTGSYLQLLQGLSLAGARFAGSRTLGAWESLAAWTRFDDAARFPSFPPHTPRGTNRVPGLLHLALRGPEDDFRDLLLTDAPGEWFTRWSTQEKAPDAAGARWVARQADAFLVLADCGRLSGDTRGQARSETRLLLERLGNHVNGRPVVLVWSKTDCSPPEGIRSAILRTLKESIPHSTQAETTSTQPETLLAALGQAVQAAWLPKPARSVTEPVLQMTPFAAFRGFHARL